MHPRDPPGTDQFPARALSGPVAPRGSESGKISSERVVARPEFLITLVDSSTNTRRQGRTYFLEPRFGTTIRTADYSKLTFRVAKMLSECAHGGDAPTVPGPVASPASHALSRRKQRIIGITSMR